MKSNLSCRECGPELTAYLDGELHPAVALALEQHLGACASCRASLEAYRDIAAGLARLPELAAPAWLDERVIGAVTGRTRGRRIVSRGLAIAAAASFAIAVGLVASLPGLARVLGLPDPSTWPVLGLRGIVGATVLFTKNLAAQIAQWEPLARVLWSAVRALEAIPRAVWITLRTPEAQIAVLVAVTMGIAFFFVLRPSRTHEGGVGHVCLML